MNGLGWFRVSGDTGFGERTVGLEQRVGLT